MADDPELQLAEYKKSLAAAQLQLADLEKQMAEVRAAHDGLQKLENSYVEGLQGWIDGVRPLEHGDTKCLRSGILKVVDELTAHNAQQFRAAIKQDLKDAISTIVKLEQQIEFTQNRIGLLDQTVSIYTIMLSC